MPKLSTPTFEWPDVSNFFSSNQSLTDRIWEHKEWVGIGTALATIAMTAAYFKFRKVAEKPHSEWSTSLTHGALTLSLPKRERLSPNVTITFCIDASGSMQGVREAGVKRGVASVIESARKVLAADPEARIGIAAQGFNSSAQQILKPVDLTQDEKACSSLTSKVRAYRSSGSTSILTGLDAALDDVSGFSRKNSVARHVIILLSDGDSTVDRSKLSTIKGRMQSLGAEVYSVGIGDHNAETLKSISGNGRYIDTRQETSIEEAISQIYDRAMATFSEMTLTVEGLPGGVWLANLARVNAGESSQMDSLTEGDSESVRISLPLDQDYDLRNVALVLKYIDPKGIRGSLRFPWQRHTRVVPAITS